MKVSKMTKVTSQALHKNREIKEKKNVMSLGVVFFLWKSLFLYCQVKQEIFVFNYSC